MIPPPRNTKAEVLHAPKSTKAMILYQLILHGVQLKALSEQGMPVKLNAFRTRISELIKEGVPIQHHEVKDKNDFGHHRTRHEHYLFTGDIEAAIAKYNEINKN